MMLALRLAGSLLLLFSLSSGLRAQDTPAAQLAKQAWTVSELLLDRHVTPPARQEMLLGVAQAIAPTKPARELARRASSLTTQAEWAKFLAELWPADAEDELAEHALAAALMRVPGTARFVPAKELAIRNQIRGNRYIGIGIQIRVHPEEKYTQLLTPIRGGPAHKAGMKPGDLITSVEGKDTKGINLQTVVDWLRGPEGTKVSLEARQPGEKKARSFTMTRTVVPFETIQGYQRGTTQTWKYRLTDGEPIAYAVVRSLTSSTQHELRQLERRLRDEGCKALILDLRFQLDGDPQMAAQLGNALLDGGVLWQTRNSLGQVSSVKADRDCLFRDWPLVVLTDPPSSQGAAWLSAALQDNERATIVGQPLPLTPYLPGEIELPEKAGMLTLPTAMLQRPIDHARVQEMSLLKPEVVIPITGAQKEKLTAWIESKNLTELPPGMSDSPPDDPQLTKAVGILKAALKKQDHSTGK